MPTMASRVSTSSLVCEPLGVSLRSRNMYFPDSRVDLSSLEIVRLTSSPGVIAGICSAVLQIGNETASADNTGANNRSCKARQDGISFIRVCAPLLQD